MPVALATLIAVISTAAFLGLWFWVARGELTRRRDMVESAKKQVLACRKKCVQCSENGEKAEAHAVLLRSEDIYRQSVALYNSALKKPWNYIPGRLMGFRPIRAHKIKEKQ